MFLDSDDLIDLGLAFQEILNRQIDIDLEFFRYIFVLEEDILSFILVKQPHITEGSLDF